MACGAGRPRELRPDLGRRSELRALDYSTLKAVDVALALLYEEERTRPFVLRGVRADAEIEGMSSEDLSLLFQSLT